MAVTPAVRVELVVPDPNAPYLTLDDAIRGELDEALYPLYDGGEPSTTVDLTAESFAYAVRRGRDNELDDVSTGTLAVNFRNYSGAFVPNSLVEAGLFDEDGNLLTDENGAALTTEWATYGYDQIIPSKRVRLYLDEVTVFDGRVDDWQLEYTVDGQCSASMTAVDALGVLAEAELDEFTDSASTVGERIVAVLDSPEVDFPATREIDAGGGSSGAESGATTNALDYVKRTVYGALGYVYASRLGVLTFEPRSSLTFTQQAAFADDGSAIPFAGISPSSSARYLYNRVTVTAANVGAVEQVAEDTASQALYGIRTLALSDVLVSDDTDAANLAGSLLSLYKSPQTRIESLRVNLGSLTDAQRATVCGLELGDFVSVTWTPRGTDEVTQSLRIEGIEFGGTYDSVGMCSLRLSPSTYYPFPFILDDADYGVLDTSPIYF